MARGTTSAVALIVLAVVGAAGVAQAAYCHGHPSPDAKPNENPVNYAPPTEVLSRAARNGRAYMAGTGNDTFWVVHLWGSPYEMGHALGEMFKDELPEFFDRVWAYMKSQVTGALDKLPPWLSSMIGTFGLELALDLTEGLTRKYTNEDYYTELQGMADATGVWVQQAIRVHLIGSLTQGDCSAFGAWGEATKDVGGGLLQLRALDWDTDGPFKDFPAVIVYHPSEGKGHPFANVGFIGWIGSITGMSSQQMAISEIGVAYPDESFGKMSRAGVPFVFLLRDILQYDKSLTEALTRMKTATRTCDLILGVGDGKTDKTFRAVQYSYSVANVQNDTNMMPHNDTWHARIPNIVYYGMDWLCPGYNKVLHDQLVKNYGKLTAEVTIHDVVPIVQTGNLHIAVYDLTGRYMYVAFARRGDVSSGPQYAYDRTFTRLNMDELFMEVPPPYQ